MSQSKIVVGLGCQRDMNTIRYSHEKLGGKVLKAGMFDDLTTALLVVG